VNAARHPREHLNASNKQLQLAIRSRRTAWDGELVTMLVILLVILLLLSVGSYPAWPYSREWGYYPSGGLGLVLLIVLILFLLGRI
jgi:hypothetical protein